jgi:competence protein ComEA
MNRLRAWIRSFFGFSRTETNAFLIMLPMMAAIVLSTPAYRWWSFTYGPLEQSGSNKLDSLVATWKWEKPPDSVSTMPAHLFPFNPNTTSITTFTQLGLPGKLSKRIIHYREKGGKFIIKQDLAKMYGMDSTLFAILKPYIDLPERPIAAIHLEKVLLHSRKPPPLGFDINLADTAQLIGIYGIGPQLSIRITRYRNRLGGFVSVDQLKEVYGLDSATVGQLKKRTFVDKDFKPRQININLADEKLLSSLPYIKFNLAKLITVYRYQHGTYDSIDVLKKIASMDEPTFQKIKPYITVKD